MVRVKNYVKLVRILTEPPMYLPPSSLMPWSNCLFWEWFLIPDIWKIYLSSTILVKNRDVNNIHHKWVIQWQLSNKITLIWIWLFTNTTERKHEKLNLLKGIFTNIRCVQCFYISPETESSAITLIWRITESGLALNTAARQMASLAIRIISNDTFSTVYITQTKHK